MEFLLCYVAYLPWPLILQRFVCCPPCLARQVFQIKVVEPMDAHCTEWLPVVTFHLVLWGQGCDQYRPGTLQVFIKHVLNFALCFDPDETESAGARAPLICLPGSGQCSVKRRQQVFSWQCSFSLCSLLPLSDWEDLRECRRLTIQTQAVGLHSWVCYSVPAFQPLMLTGFIRSHFGDRNWCAQIRSQLICRIWNSFRSPCFAVW